MWRSIFVGLVVILLCALTTTSQAQMYWSDSSGDESVSSGFAGPGSDAGRPSQTRGSFRMYDYTEAPEPEVEVVPQAPAAPPTRPRQEDASRERTDSSLRSPERTPSTTSTVTSPRPAVTTPGGAQVAPESERTPGAADKVETKRPASVGTSPAEQPVTKKMKWGQGDAGATEPGTKPPAGQ